MLRKIECFLIPSKLDRIRDLVVEKGLGGMSVTSAQGFGSHSVAKTKKGKPEFEEHIKVEIVVPESAVEEIISDIKKLAGAGEIGAGKIFVIPVEDAIRLSTRESGRSAIF